MEPAFLKFDIKIKMTVAKDEYTEGALRLFLGTLLHFLDTYLELTSHGKLKKKMPP